MISCDITSLLMWFEGILIDMKMGRGHVCNELVAEKAEKALERGEKVQLTDDDEIVGYVEMKNGELVWDVDRDKLKNVEFIEDED